MNTATGHLREPRIDHAGFAALFDQRFESTKRLAFLLGADDPENIAQEAFVRLHHRWAVLASQEKALPYLRKTVVNLSRNRLRRLRVVRRTPRERPPDTASAETMALAGQAFREALATLTTRQRQWWCRGTGRLARGRSARRMPVLAVAAVVIPVAMNGTEPSGNVRAGESTSSATLSSSPGQETTDAPNVVTLEISDAAGMPVPVQQVAETGTARYFFAKFPAATEGYQYTAKDAGGNVVESGTT